MNNIIKDLSVLSIGAGFITVECPFCFETSVLFNQNKIACIGCKDEGFHTLLNDHQAEKRVLDNCDDGGVQGLPND